MKRMRQIPSALGAAAALLWSAAVPGWAQSCALCAKNVAASGSKGIQGLQTGIILLLVPALLFFIGIFVFALRYRNPDDEAFSEEPVEPRGKTVAREWELPLQQEQAGRN